MSRRKGWSHSVGYRGCIVRVYDRGGFIQARIALAGAAPQRKSLKHQDREAAKDWAKAEQAKLKLGLSVLDSEKPTAARIIDAYLAARTPLKENASTRQQDERAGAMWLEVLGAGSDLSQLSHDTLDRFVKDRLSGVMDPHGKRVAKAEDRHPVRVRAAAADLEFLRAVVRWAHEQPAAKQLLRSNPLRGYAIPKEANPRRPVASQDRYEQLLAVADQVHPFLGQLLAITNGTGRRVSAVLNLRYQDLKLGEGKCGAIVWPADTDKMGAEWSAPMSVDVRAAIDRVLADRPGIGAAYLFPAPANPSKAMDRWFASKLLRRAERLAKLEKQRGSLWHAYRRKWGSERKHLPVQDVAKAGGWKSLAVLQTIYQQPDPETMYQVVSEPRRLREAK